MKFLLGFFNKYFAQRSIEKSQGCLELILSLLLMDTLVLLKELGKWGVLKTTGIMVSVALIVGGLLSAASG